jgi:hypothetical protein
MKTFFVILLALGVSGCVSNPPNSQPSDNKTISLPNTGETEKASSEIPFTPEPAFDDDLSEAMDEKTGQIEVALTESVDPDQGEMPVQLNKWLAAIEESGGKIHYEPLPEPMNLTSNFDVNSLLNFSLQAFSIFRQHWYQEYQEERPKYQAAEKYDARLCYHRDDNLVSKIVFVERGKSTTNTKTCSP